MDFRSFDIARLHRELAAYRITPLDIARHCIAQVENLDADIAAWVRTDPERLIEVARSTSHRLAQGEPLRLLEAVPVGVKDIFNTADYPTEMGSPIWKGFTPGNDARAVFNLLRSGGWVAGKTATAEFAVHTLGKTLNPWDPERTPGTSSSGSAAAVAMAMVPAALGTQTAGSIIRPASFCGVWGMKPSFGLIPRTGMLKTTDSLDTVGFFTGHAQRQTAPCDRPWRVAFVQPHVWPHAMPHAKAAMLDWVRRLDAHPRFEVTQAELPAELSESHEIHATIYNRALAYYFQDEYRQAEFVSPVMRDLIALGQRIAPQEYAQALDRQVHLARAADRFARHFDVIVTLSTAGEAPRRHVQETPDSALIWTLAQLPSVNAPAFMSPRGLPYGLQIVARRYNDPLMLQFVSEAVAQGFLPVSGHAPVRTAVEVPEYAAA